jgi:hypothetical protein
MFTWAAGAAISGAYSVVDSALGNSIIPSNLPFLYHYDSLTRANGLTHHPNALGQTITLALPLLIYMVGATRGWAKAVMTLLLPISMYAILLSGSRGALLGGTVMAVATFAYLVISGKRIHALVVPVVMCLVPLAIVIVPAVLGSTRYFTKSGDISDGARHAKFQRGLDLFETNPVFGAGVGRWFSEVAPLNILVSGGILFFFVFYGALAYPLLTRSRSSGGAFASILVISGLGVFGYGLLNNGIVERYLYWPFAALFALSLAHSQRTNTATVNRIR